MTRTVQLLRDVAYNCHITCKYMTSATVQLMLKSGLLMTNQIREFCYSYDYLYTTSIVTTRTIYSIVVTYRNIVL